MKVITVELNKPGANVETLEGKYSYGCHNTVIVFGNALLRKKP